MAGHLDVDKFVIVFIGLLGFLEDRVLSVMTGAVTRPIFTDPRGLLDPIPSLHV